MATQGHRQGFNTLAQEQQQRGGSPDVSPPRWVPKNANADTVRAEARRDAECASQQSVRGRSTSARGSSQVPAVRASSVKTSDKTQARVVIAGIPATGVPSVLLPERGVSTLSSAQLASLVERLRVDKACQKYSLQAEWRNGDSDGPWTTWVGASTDVKKFTEDGVETLKMSVNWIPTSCPGLMEIMKEQGKDTSAASLANHALPFPYPGVEYRSLRLIPSVDAAATAASASKAVQIMEPRNIPTTTDNGVVIDHLVESNHGEDDDQSTQGQQQHYVVKMSKNSAVFPAMTATLPDPVGNGVTRHNVNPHDVSSWWAYVVRSTLDWERRMWEVAEMGGWNLPVTDTNYVAETLRTLILLNAQIMFEHCSAPVVTQMNRLTFEAALHNEASKNSARKDGARVNIAAARNAVLAPQSTSSNMRMLFTEFTERVPAAAAKASAAPNGKKKGTCHRCGRAGHFEKACRATVSVSGEALPLQRVEGFRGGGGMTTSGAAGAAPKATSQQH